MAIIQEQNDPSKSKYPAFLVIPDGEFADQRFDMKLNVCDSPTCRCTDIHISLFNQKGSTWPIQFAVDLDLREKVPISQSNDPKEDLLTETVAKSFGKSDWEFLWNVFNRVKEVHTVNLDPYTTEYSFPMSRDIEDHNELVPFSDVLPHAEKFIMERPGEKILIDEQYCLVRGCGCERTLVAFIVFENKNNGLTQKEGEAPMMFLDYTTGAITNIDVGDFPEMDLRGLLNEFLAKTPDLLAVFKKRHEQLSVMYKEYWRRNHERPQTKTMKAGRNETCPCGSGKKFKKCCLLSTLDTEMA